MIGQETKKFKIGTKEQFLTRGDALAKARAVKAALRANRKPTEGVYTIDKEKARRMILRAVSKNIREITQGQIELAKGVFYEKHDKQYGKMRVYKDKPDAAAAQYLFNQMIGKPTESYEVSGKGGKAIVPILNNVFNVLPSNNGNPENREIIQQDKSDTGRNLSQQDRLDNPIPYPSSPVRSEAHVDEHSIGELPTP